MKQNYYGVQALRGLGAVLVIIFHATVMLRERLDPTAWFFTAGAAGVDLFFAISGFIIVVATHDSWGQPNTAGPFLKRRLIRIVPLYWMITTVKLAILVAGGKAVIDSWHTLSSYLFIPAWNAEHKVFPVLVQGWTLSYEVFFYLLFASMLLLRKVPVLPLSIIFTVLAAVGFAFAPFESALLKLLDQRLLEFVMGMWIAQLALSGRLIPASAAWALIPLSLAVLIGSTWFPPVLIDSYPLLAWGVPSAVLLYAVVSCEQATVWRNAILRAVGDASYAIYLTHEFAVSAVRVFIQKLHITGPMMPIIMIALCIIIACVGGWIIHLLVEKPVTRWLRNYFGARDKVRPA